MTEMHPVRVQSCAPLSQAVQCSMKGSVPMNNTRIAQRVGKRHSVGVDA